MRVIEGKLEAAGLRFALVVSRFNEALVSRLESGAIDYIFKAQPIAELLARIDKMILDYAL